MAEQDASGKAKKRCSRKTPSTSTKKERERAEYLRSVCPSIPVEMVPRLRLRTCRANTTTIHDGRRLWEFTIGCNGHISFAGDEPTQFCRSQNEDGGATMASFIDLLNCLSWGYRDGCTAICLGGALHEDLLLDSVVMRDLPASVRRSRLRQPPRQRQRLNVMPVIPVPALLLYGGYGFEQNTTVGTVSWSETGRVVEFAVSYDRLERRCEPAGAPCRFRDNAGHYSTRADLRAVVIFDQARTDFETMLLAGSSVAKHALHDRDPSFPAAHVGTAERLSRWCDTTFSAFVDALRRTPGYHPSEVRCMTLLVLDPREYHRKSLIGLAVDRLFGDTSSQSDRVESQDPPPIVFGTNNATTTETPQHERLSVVLHAVPRSYTACSPFLRTMKARDYVALVSSSAESDRSAAIDFLRLAVFGREELALASYGDEETANAVEDLAGTVLSLLSKSPPHSTISLSRLEHFLVASSEIGTQLYGMTNGV